MGQLPITLPNPQKGNRNTQTVTCPLWLLYYSNGFGNPSSGPSLHSPQSLSLTSPPPPSDSLPPNRKESLGRSAKVRAIKDL